MRVMRVSWWVEAMLARADEDNKICATSPIKHITRAGTHFHLVCIGNIHYCGESHYFACEIIKKILSRHRVIATHHFHYIISIGRRVILSFKLVWLPTLVGKNSPNFAAFLLAAQLKY